MVQMRFEVEMAGNQREGNARMMIAGGRNRRLTGSARIEAPPVTSTHT